MAANVLSDLNLSPQEMERFTKAMKDPQFMELLNEYAQEISQPMNKEEAENYVKMVEDRSQFSMEGKELVIPTPDFCFKTKEKKKGSKFFINICHSEKLGHPQSTPRADGSGAEWQIPYGLSPMHTDKDKGGVACASIDYVVNEEVCKHCKKSKYFKRFVAETAIDSVEKQYGLQLQRDIVFPKLKYKGPTNKPKMLTIPLDVKHTGVDKSCERSSSSKDKKSASCSSTPLAVGKSSVDCSHENGTNREDKLDAAQQYETKRKEVKEDKKLEESLSEPPFVIIYRNGLDFSEFWMDGNIECNSELKKPEEILLRVCLPEVMNARDVELDVSDTGAILKVPGLYKLQVKWRYLVDSAKSFAKFDKSNHKLEVSLPVHVHI